MEAIWLENNKLSIRDDIPVPKIPEGEALIKVTLAGICSTDLELVKGYYPFTGILGHEFVGIVISAPGFKEYEGKRVVGEINATCGECAECKAGNRSHCLQRTVLGISNRHGAFAEYMTLPVENLHILDSQVSDDQAVFVEPLAAALEIFEQIPIMPSSRVLLIGAGRLGLLIAQCFRLTPCDFWTVVRHSHQRRLLDGWGIPYLEVDDIPDKGFDTVIEATGTTEGFLLARKALRPRGRLVLKSTYHGLLEINMSSIVVDEITIVGSRCGPFTPAIRLLREKKVDVSPLIMGRYPLSAGIDAFVRAAEKGVLKILLAVSE